MLERFNVEIPPPLPPARPELPKQQPSYYATKPLPPLPPNTESNINHINYEAVQLSPDNYINPPSISSAWSLGMLSQNWPSESTRSKSSALLDSHDRFKPEKNQRPPLQKMKWTQSRSGRSLAGDLFSYGSSLNTTVDTGSGHGNNFYTNILNNGIPKHFITDHLPLESESRVSSMSIADVSPRLAVKKVLVLYEHAQYVEAANFIQRLSVSTFRIILRELPLDILIEAMPNSLPIMEALYTKVYASDGPGPGVNLKILKPESIVLHMVKYYSYQEEMLRESRKGKDSIGLFTSGCKKILRVIVMAEPRMLKWLQQKRRAMDKAVEGMGQHGLVGTTDESLLPLHDALKLDFRRVVDAYKGALQKLEDLSLSNKNHPKNVSTGPAPIHASHQRQLSLRAEEIQERLIKNKSLLNVVEPTLDNHCLDVLLGILQRRIECDKDALFQFTQLRKDTGDTASDDVVAPLLMRYSKGCKQVLDMMKESAQEAGENLAIYEDDSSDLSGYHSDSDSAIMTSGNSPFVSPRARFNFISRSVRCKGLFRPSIISSFSASSSGVISANSRSGSSLRDFISPVSIPGTPNTHLSSNPIRPRHVKHKNQLYKNNSLVSNSSGESESSGSLRSVDEARSIRSSTTGCVEYVTVVTVPENQVLSQGINKRNITETLANDIRVTELKNEINQLRLSLQSANLKISQLQQNEIRESPASLNANSPKVAKNESRDYWIRQYGALYATARVDTMDALDAIKELASADELKSKLLFSVLVLSFRSVQSSVSDVMTRMRQVLQMDSNQETENCSEGEASDPFQAQILNKVGEYLVNSSHRFDLSKAVQQVANQLWTTLYDYPCLKQCDGLRKYIQACVNLAWGLSNINPPCRLEFETRTFRREMHVRFHSSDQSSENIRTYLWPALLEGKDSICVHKGVVIT